MISIAETGKQRARPCQACRQLHPRRELSAKDAVRGYWGVTVAERLRRNIRWDSAGKDISFFPVKAAPAVPAPAPAPAPMAAPLPPPAIPPISAPRAEPPPMATTSRFLWDLPSNVTGCVLTPTHEPPA